MSGCTVLETIMVFLFVFSIAITEASTAAVAPSYIDEFETSIPVKLQIIVWYSKTACKVPWLISGWYGV